MNDSEFTISPDDIRMAELMKRREFYRDCVAPPLEAALDWLNTRGHELNVWDEDRRRVQTLTDQVHEIMKGIDDEIRSFGKGDPDDIERLDNHLGEESPQ